MKATYILHSSFLLETDSCTLLFDYYDGKCPAIRPDKPLFVFASHGHHDHFSGKVFEIPGPDAGVHYILSDDLGVAFIIETDGLKIYHAGDLNNWWWEGDEEDRKLADLYHEELRRIEGMEFDAAFVPLDPRIKGYELGIEDFLGYCDAKRIFPMHMWEKYGITDELLGRPEAGDLAEKIVRIEREGQEFVV